jgi:Cof subfamily protein (haloacid dehalogenase superfamily)
MTPASEIRLIALDVDGTLAARDNEVTPRTRESLHRAVAAGIHVAIATGRRYRTTLRVVEALGLPVDVVCLGGALVKDREGATLEAAAFEADDFESIHGLAREHGHAIVCHRDSAEQGGADFVIDADIEWNSSTRAYVEQNLDYVAHGSGLGHETCPDALVIGAFAAEPELRGWHAAIEDRHPGHFLPSLVPGGLNDGWYFELTPRNVSKWSGLQALARRLGIDPSSICAVGDQVNDLPMLEGAGMSVAMGNAVDAVKQSADWVTGPNDEDGIVAVVERILGR